MNEIMIRTAVRKDLPAIVKLLAADEVAGSGERLTDPIPESYVAAFEAISADPNHGLFVADKDGEIMGTFQLSFIPNMTYQGGWRAQIEGVMVSAKHRNQGIGSAMMRWAIARPGKGVATWCNSPPLTSELKPTGFIVSLGSCSVTKGPSLP